jgi:hypothetical protein
MSLGKLLKSGKCLIGGQSEAHRYRVDKRALLPKFGSPKNPFASGAQQERAEARPTAAVPTEAKVRATNAPAPPAALRKLSPVRALKWAGELAAKLNPLVLVKRRPAAVLRAAARPNSPRPVQRELSLDAVQVLRNDLTDADTEASGGMRPAPKNFGVFAVTAKAEVAMDKLSSKFFGQVDA